MSDSSLFPVPTLRPGIDRINKSLSKRRESGNKSYLPVDPLSIGKVVFWGKSWN